VTLAREDYRAAMSILSVREGRGADPPSTGRCSTKHFPLPLPILDGGEADAGADADADAGDSDAGDAGDAGAAPLALQYSCVGGRVMTEPCTGGKP
jgi:hypothetical protein